jgi:general secretion pathway protein M
MAIRIGRRDRNALLIGGVAVCLFAVVKFAVFPVLDRKEALERTIASQSESLREMVALRTEYEQLVQRSEQAKQRFDRREKGFTLFSFLDRLAGQADIKDSITYMKPSVVNPKNSPYSISQVEMKIQNTTMERLVRYLQLIEQSVNTVSVRRLSITRIERPEARLTAFLLVETPEPTPGPSGG